MTRRATTQLHIGLDAPGDARRFVRSTLDTWDDETFCADAELLVSEVVTVATLQSGSARATVAVAEDDDTIRVEVSDVHRGFALALAERGNRDGAQAASGLGLNIVDWVAPRWGVDLTKPGKTVWFELDATAPRREFVEPATVAA